MTHQRPSRRVQATTTSAIGLLAITLCILSPGCAKDGTPAILAAVPGARPAPPTVETNWTASSVDVLRMQAEVMDFADDFMLRLGDVVDRIEATDPPMRGRMLSHKLRVRTAQGVIAIATSHNPLVAQADMLVMVTLQRRLLETAFNPQDFEVEWEALTRVFIQGEEQMRSIAARSLTPGQLAEIDEVVERWIENNPSRSFATGVRLENFAAARQTTVTEPGRPQSVFALLRIDPLSGLNPTSREIEQSRLLAERAFYYVQRAPQLIAWQTELLLIDSLNESEVQSLVRSASEFSNAATDLTDQTEELSEAIPGLVAEEREAAIDQAADRLSVEREAAIDQAFQRLAEERHALLDEITAREAELNATMENLRATITAAESLVAGSQDLVNAVDQLAVRMGSDDEPSGEPGPTLADYERILERADAVIAETTRAVEAIDDLAANDAWDERAATIETVSTGLEARVGRVIERAFWYALVLVGAALVGSLIVGLILRAVRQRVAYAPVSSEPPPRSAG